MTRLIGLLLVVGLTLVASGAWAQTNTTQVTTNPSAVSGGNAEIDGTLAATNTWQLVFGALKYPQFRNGCLVMNTDTTVLRVAFVAPVNGATTAPASATAGFPLAVAGATGGQGAAMQCASGSGGTLQDAVYVLGTSGSSFRALQE